MIRIQRPPITVSHEKEQTNLIADKNYAEKIDFFDEARNKRPIFSYSSNRVGNQRSRKRIQSSKTGLASSISGIAYKKEVSSGGLSGVGGIIQAVKQKADDDFEVSDAEKRKRERITKVGFKFTDHQKLFD